MKKVLFTASVARHIKSFHIPYLNYFKENGFKVYVATRDEEGVNHMKLIVNNLLGIANEENIGEYEEGVYMMKYNEICIKKGI